MYGMLQMAITVFIIIWTNCTNPFLLGPTIYKSYKRKKIWADPYGTDKAKVRQWNVRQLSVDYKLELRKVQVNRRSLLWKTV